MNPFLSRIIVYKTFQYLLAIIKVYPCQSEFLSMAPLKTGNAHSNAGDFKGAVAKRQSPAAKMTLAGIGVCW